MDTEFTECVRLFQNGKTADCIKKLLNFLADQPEDLDAQFLLALIGNSSPDSDPVDGVFDGLLRHDHRTADDYERVGYGLRAAKLEKLAAVAFKAAAARDRENQERPQSWGEKPFNGQEKRVALFQTLNKRIKIDAVVETGTFRGSTTLFFRQTSGVDVYSCELSDRYFEYASTRLAGCDGIHLYKGDSRDFLVHLSKTSKLENNTIFFYLDAHWNADLPLLEELQFIFKHFESPIIMIDDFEVAHRDDYDFDDYGENAILSIDILAPALTEEISLFYPSWQPQGEYNERRGFVILAEGEFAQKIGALTEYLITFDRFGAALQQMKRYRRMFRESEERVAKLEQLERFVDEVQRSIPWRGSRWIRRRTDRLSRLWRR
jgi:predicted O-methyltransferase YrrM